MDYEEFRDNLVAEVQKNLYERGQEVNVRISDVEKLNDSYEAMSITPEDGYVGINLNLNAIFASYENGTEYHKLVSAVTDEIETQLTNMPEFDVESLTDYSKMRDTLAMEVVSLERNATFLTKVPHQELEDMAVVYRFVVDSNEEGRSSILVTNEMLNKMGVTPEQLHADALERAPELRPAVITGLSEIIGPSIMETFGEDALPADELMYVASVPDRISGAGVIAYQEFMDQAAERLGGDFFVLPSSVHEVLLLKDDGAADYRFLQSMVEEVNATQVAPDEKLTDSVYHYDSKEHVFELAEKFETRQQEKKAERTSEKEERGSVLKDLKDKQQDVAKSPAKDVQEKASKSKGGAEL